MPALACLADLHFGRDSAGALRAPLESVCAAVDAILIAGDLTRGGAVEEAEVLADELRPLEIPIVSVLGNHDFHRGEQELIGRTMRKSGVIVLEASCHVLRVGEIEIGIAGVKGFGGGFDRACLDDFGEPETKAFIRHTQRASAALRAQLAALRADRKIALLHYSPTRETLGAESPEIFPFLGSSLLGEAIDEAGADLVLHGHAHAGVEKGATPGGVPVRNVAQSVLGAPCAVYELAAT